MQINLKLNVYDQDIIHHQIVDHPQIKVEQQQHHYYSKQIQCRDTRLDTNRDEKFEFFTIYNTMHPRISIARLYLLRKEGGKGKLSMEDQVDSECRAPSKCLNP